MKNKTINKLLLLCYVLLLFSCKKDKTVEVRALELDSNAIEIQEGYTATIEILGGNGNYTVSETSLVTVDIRDEAITFSTTENYGEERVFVRDGAGQKVAVDITVIPAVLGSDDPRFYWNGLIALEQPNGWATTVMDNTIAITNIEEKKQYALSWNGKFEIGVKPRAVLRILGEEGREEISLTKLEILNIDQSKSLCTMVFYKEKQKGELVFSLP